jgi:glycosyltransferase involved in cell wall biosynthesis
MRVTVVTNLCAHYRVRTFELLARRLGADFLFFSRGREEYWPTRFGVRRGDFPHRYLAGFEIAGTRITPSLVPRLLFRRRDAVIKCINGRFALPATYLAARLRHLPFVLWTGIWQRLGSPFHRLMYPVTRWIYRHADAVVVYGSHVARFLVGEGVDPERIFIAPHATENERYRRAVTEAERGEVRDRAAIPATAPLVLFVGRLVPEKGVHVLLEAFARLQRDDAHLLLVGDGADRVALEAEAARRGLARRVHVDTTVTPDQVVPVYAAADVLVLPSVTTFRFREPWGLVVNEAFNQGVPAVVSDAVGAAAGGLVRDGETGRVVEEGDAAALASALDDLLADDAWRHVLGETARRRVLEWSDEAMVEGFSRAVEHARRRRSRTSGSRPGAIC